MFACQQRFLSYWVSENEKKITKFFFSKIPKSSFNPSELFFQSYIGCVYSSVADSNSHTIDVLSSSEDGLFCFVSFPGNTLNGERKMIPLLVVLAEQVLQMTSK